MSTFCRGCRGGYTFLNVQAEIKKRRVVIVYKGQNRCVDQVYVEEIVSTNAKLAI